MRPPALVFFLCVRVVVLCWVSSWDKVTWAPLFDVVVVKQSNEQLVTPAEAERRRRGGGPGTFRRGRISRSARARSGGSVTVTDR